MRPGRLIAGAALALVAVLLLAGCTTTREVLSSDRAQRREVAIVSGATPAQPPPSPAFQHLTPLQVEASLRHLIVRPGRYLAGNLGDPGPFLTPEQVAWARDAIAPLLPKLHPDQRMELRFEDHFHHYAVDMEVYGEGADLVYRFTKLAAAPVTPSMTTDTGRPVNWVTFVVQPGQRYSYDREAYYLRDSLFANPQQALRETDLLAVLRKGAAERKLPDDELGPVKEVLHQHPQITVDALNLYLDKLQLVDRAQQQGLFSQQEADARRRTLLQELTPGAAPAAPAAAPAAQ